MEQKSSLERLEEVVQTLKGLYSELAFHKKNELIAKREAYNSDFSQSVSAREKYASFSAAEHTIAVWETEATISSLIEEKWLINTLLKYGS